MSWGHGPSGVDGFGTHTARSARGGGRLSKGSQGGNDAKEGRQGWLEFPLLLIQGDPPDGCHPLQRAVPQSHTS
jgi:hypothetical protein